ncbi:dihydrofolate reductase family protein [Solicola gregarius]|uniref:Dihydrofolate reductase family protein n=1 Tax=Solicola gregarius TaxID=2908642 RepID=A0AA46TLS9_9ACTN|nr:dihydrofolate reductase family protein [Solicola gregarius]UYM07657.1 dihydrofolate reductase family protein [Solicola gregarius]
MRKIVAGLYASLAGVVDSGGSDSWQAPYLDAEALAGIEAGIAQADAILLGRRTYLEFAELWPAQPDSPMTRFMNETPKYIASTTLQSVEWTNSRLLTGELTEALRTLRSQPGKNILVPGSPRLVRVLLETGMLDELHLNILPIAVGSGTHLFDGLADHVGLDLVEVTPLRSGVLSAAYHPAEPGSNR